MWEELVVMICFYCTGGTSGSLSVKKRRVDLGLCGGGGLPPPAHANSASIGEEGR